MEKQIRYTLKKDERLKSRKLIEQLFKDGETFSSFPIRVIYSFTLPALSSSANILQTGFGVSTKNFKKAVDRNRIKRLLRESYRLQKNELAEQVKLKDKKLVIFFMFNGKELPDHKLIYDKVQKGIQRLQKIMNEDISSNT